VLAGKVFDSVGDKLGERWADNLFTPALLFWGGGLGAWCALPGCTFANGSALRKAIADLSSPEQFAALVAALVLVLASSAAAERFTPFLLRLFAGAWPAWAQPLSARLIAGYVERRARLDTTYQTLSERLANKTITRSEARELVDVTSRLSDFPTLSKYVQPTLLGNVLQTAERLPEERYGLESTVCFARLWLAMPDAARTELSSARTQLDTSARLTFWAILFALWTFLSWAALPFAAALAYYGYRSMLGDARAYGELFVAAFDVNRRALYKSVGFSYPANASVEYVRGRDLTAFLRDGDDRITTTFSATD
jgi:hypothetical protein